MTELAFSPACERNKAPILAILRDAFADRTSVLEIGAGTGQHAVCFAAGLPQLIWWPSDCGDYLPELAARVASEGPPNCRPPLELDVNRPWPAVEADAVFSANTLHILHWPSVQSMFRGAARVLAAGGTLAIYGPFNYHGRFTSPSNAAFDASLRQRDPGMGIRDFEAVEELGAGLGFRLLADHDMPANNRLLVWTRSPAAPPT